MSNEVGQSAAAEELPLDFYKIPIDLYRSGEKVETDLYFYYQRQYVLFKSKDSVWQDQDIDKLINTQVSSLFVKFRSPAEHHRFLQSKLQNILDRPKVSVERKAKVLYEIADPILSRVFSTPNSQELLLNAGSYAKSCIQYLNEKGSLPELVKLSTSMITEHEHALHVSTYSVALARKMGYRDEAQIFALGLGALLHDIGKSKIDSKILMKPGELSDDEWLLVRQHPDFGKEILEPNSVIPPLAKKIVHEHHERVNGKGYPRGIKGLHVFSKIVGIADCFNMITSERPYEKALPPFEALKYMIQTMKSEFDQALLTKFIEMLSH